MLVVDVNEAAAASVAEGIAAAGGQAAAFRADLAEEQEVVAAVAAAKVQFGRLDVLHNNAALTDSDFLSADTAVTELSLDVWERTMAVNLRSQMLMCKHAVPIMVEGGGGSIINMSSGASLKGDRDADRLRGLEGRGQRPHHVRGDEPREAGHPGQHDPAGARHHRRRAGPPQGGHAGLAQQGHA